MVAPCSREGWHHWTLMPLTPGGVRNIIQATNLSREQNLDPDQVARMVVDVASDKQAQDIVLLDIRRLTSFADYFVIMTAESGRQLEALREDLVSALKSSGVSINRGEGSAEAGWVLLDYTDVIIHLFGPEERDFYALELLWAGAPQVVRIL